jgi:hypothetical protein
VVIDLREREDGIAAGALVAGAGIAVTFTK